MSNDQLQVMLNYKLLKSEEWITLSISPDDYYDLEPGEIPEADSIPKNNHAIDYINEDKGNIETTKIIICSNNKITKLINEYFWDDGSNRIIERIDLDSNNERLIELETKISDEPLVYEVMRLFRKNGTLQPEYHGFITRNIDGTETEKKVRIN